MTIKSAYHSMYHGQLSAVLDTQRMVLVWTDCSNVFPKRDAPQLSIPVHAYVGGWIDSPPEEGG